jgi:hypothetical protein
MLSNKVFSHSPNTPTRGEGVRREVEEERVRVNSEVPI